MIAVALTLVRYQIDTRYNKFNYISTDMYSLYVNNTQNYNIFNSIRTPRNVEAQAISPLPTMQCTWPLA
jgi:hypothetical protein